jgi:hypothetical protein
MENLEKNFGEIYKDLSIDQRDLLVCEIAQRCNFDIITIRAWANRTRRPRRRSRERTMEILREKGLLSSECNLTF